MACGWVTVLLVPLWNAKLTTLLYFPALKGSVSKLPQVS